MSAALELCGVSKAFGSIRALRDVSLRVPRRGLFGLLGPNGAGKTTLLSLAAGFLRPDAGAVKVLGADATDFAQLCGRVSLLPQDAELQPRVALGAQLAHFARLAGLSSSQCAGAARRALAAVGLEELGLRAPRTLSHGMRKRAALAQALLGEPELLFLDEPTAGLDPGHAREVRDLVRRLGRDRTVVLCSHNLHEIQELCDEVAILRRGRVVDAGPMARLTADALRVRIALHAPSAADAPPALATLSQVSAVEVLDEHRLEVQLDASAAADRAAAQKALLARLLERNLVPAELRSGTTLERRFLELVGEERGVSGEE